MKEYEFVEEPFTLEEKTGKVPFVLVWKKIRVQKTEVAIPVIVTYGIYPKIHVNDSDLIERLEKYAFIDATGYSFLDGEYYAKKIVDPNELASVLSANKNIKVVDSHEYSFVFSDGAKITSKTDCWFKCEPIQWHVLEDKLHFVSKNGSMRLVDEPRYLVSTMILDAYRFNERYEGKNQKGFFANNYSNSEIRSWLNDEFYRKAFGLSDKSFILNTRVENGALTTSSSTNRYACADTHDNIYLPSYKDYTENTVDYPNKASKYCEVTDWAKGNYANYDRSGSYEGNGWYLTRSPNDLYLDLSYFVDFVSSDGLLDYYYFVDYEGFGVRPAITITLPWSKY